MAAGAAADARATLRVLVTRPQPHADRWAARLRDAGFDAHALPLLAIAEPADPGPLERARAALASYGTAVFVSPTAVERFLRPPGRAPLAWPPGLEAGAPGEGTADALAAAGVPRANTVSPSVDGGTSFDAVALWRLFEAAGVERFRGRRVLLVRGADGRDALVDRLRDAGATVDVVAAYERVDAALDASALALVEAALDVPERHAWLLASGSAVDAVVRAAGPRRDALARATAVAIHPRIAERARAHGMGRVLEAEAGFAGVVRCLESAAP